MRRRVIETMCIAAAAAAMAGAGTLAQGAGEKALKLSEEMLPPNAKPGECYARVFAPPQFSTTTETLLKREASEKVEVVPARYEWVEEKVLVKEASERLEVVPATYSWVEEKVLVSPESKRLEVMPAKFETVSEKVLATPARVEWKKGEGPYQRIDNATGEIMCLVEVPATYKTVTKTVMKSPPTTREVVIPAKYKTIKKRVLGTPPATRRVEIPAEYATVKVQKLVTPPTTRKVEIPAEYQSVTKTVKTSEGRMEWMQVLCKTNATPAAITSLQRALQTKGLYRGPIDGIVGSQTLAAVRQYQKSTGLAEGGLTIETLKSLGVSAN